MIEVYSSSQKPRALIASLSPIHRDPRVLNQITWLTQAGVEVDVVGTTPGPDVPGVRYFVVDQLPLTTRLVKYIFLSPAVRFTELILQRTDVRIWDRLSGGHYTHAVLNDLDFIPLLTQLKATVAPGTHTHLDLHEFFPGTKGPLIWEIMQRRYLNWLIDQSRIAPVASYSSISLDLCKEYQDFYPGRNFKPVLNVPKVRLRPYEPRDSRKVNIIYHGVAGKGRSLVRILWTFRKLGENFTLTYMLMCSPIKRLGFRLLARVLGLGPIFTIVKPVKTSEIPTTVSRFDMGITFSPPIFRNLEFSFPNKFFETLAGGAGVICGESKTIATLVKDGNLGVVVPGWTSRALRETISKLSREQVEVFRQNASKSRIDLEWEKSRSTFLKCLRLDS